MYIHITRSKQRHLFVYTGSIYVEVYSIIPKVDNQGRWKHRFLAQLKEPSIRYATSETHGRTVATNSIGVVTGK